MNKRPAPESEPCPSVVQRRYFYFTAAVTGAAIMIIEILGAKMLAPYVGTSHFVWTAQIAVTLVALATGYYAGGRWADRSPKLGSLYLGIIGAALYLCVAATQVERVAYACLRFKLAVGSLLASAALFFVPLALLAAVGPFVIRSLTSSLQNVGDSMGRLTAISTLGSFAGTILIGYVLIPLLPNSMTMLLTAVALILVALVYLLIWGNGFGPKTVAVLALMFGSACGYELHAQKMLIGPKLQEIYRHNSNFGQLQVIQARNGPQRYLLNDYLMQGAYDTETRQSTAAFLYLLHDLARAYNTNIGDVLFIGLGVGIVPMQFAREGDSVDVVEINPAMMPLARQYFDCDPARMNLTLGDGRQFVNGSRKRYDAIILDAFLGDSTPAHLMSREAFVAMHRCLKPEGVLVINAWGSFTADKDFMIASLQKTLASVFPGVRIHSDYRSGLDKRLVNVFLVASPAELVIRQKPTFDQVHPFCRSQVEAAFNQVLQTDPAHGIVLTDDYNPVEYHDAANREQERRRMAMLMQH